MRNILSLSIFVLLSFFAVGQMNPCLTRNARMQQKVDSAIVALCDRIVGSPFGFYPNQETWILEHYLCRDELATLADTHANANVRAVAVWCLMCRYPNFSKGELFKHVVESDWVNIGFRCVLAKKTVGDFLIEKAVDNLTLTLQDWRTIDSVLVHSEHAYNVGRRHWLVENLEHNDYYTQLMRRLAANPDDFAALNYLVSNPEDVDTSLVINALREAFSPRIVAMNKRQYRLQMPRMEHAVYMIRNWYHPAFRRCLQQQRDTLLATVGFLPEELFRCAFVYEEEWIKSFVNDTFAYLEKNDSAEGKKKLKQTAGSLYRAVDSIKRYNGNGTLKASSCISTKLFLSTESDYPLDSYLLNIAKSYLE